MKLLEIGDKIEAKFAYSRKCSSRFDHNGEWNEPKPKWFLKPAKKGFSGFVVGKRHVIMADFKPTYGKGTGEDYEQGWVAGTREWVWLVADSVKHEPLIVRDCDIEGDWIAEHK